MTSIAQSPPLNIACVGDSITQSVALVAKWESYPALLAALLKGSYGGYGADPPADVPPYGTMPRVTNLGVGGLHVSGLFPIVLPYVAGARNVLLVMCGTNDIHNGGPPPNEGGAYPGTAPVNTARATFDLFRQYLAQAAAQGWEVVVLTCTKGFWQDWPELDAYNDMLRTLGCPVVDVDADEYVGKRGTLINRVWFQADKTHPMGAGNQRIAEAAFRTLSAS
jgi:lysophospholipase L1-like esterase